MKKSLLIFVTGMLLLFLYNIYSKNAPDKSDAIEYQPSPKSGEQDVSVNNEFRGSKPK